MRASFFHKSLREGLGVDWAPNNSEGTSRTLGLGRQVDARVFLASSSEVYGTLKCFLLQSLIVGGFILLAGRGVESLARLGTMESRFVTRLRSRCGRLGRDPETFSSKE